MLDTQLSALTAQAIAGNLRQLVSEGYTVTFSKPTPDEWGDDMPDDAVHVRVLRADGSQISGGYGWQGGMCDAYGMVPEEYPTDA